MKTQAVFSRIAMITVLTWGSSGEFQSAAAASMPAAEDHGGTRTVNVDDPALHMVAYTMQIPKNWGFSGMIARPGGCHAPQIAADGLTFTALAPDGVTANEKLPGVTWAWSSDGANFGNCKPVKIDSALGFLLNIAIPNLRPDAKNITVIALPAEMQQAIDARNRQSPAGAGGRTTVDSARVRLAYSYKDRPVEEMLIAILTCREMDMPAYPMLHRPAVQRHICSATGTIIRRAPQGKLDALLAQNPPSAQIDPQWDNLIQQQMRSQFAAWQKANDEQFRAIQDHFQEVTQGMKDRAHQFQEAQKTSFDHAMAQDRATQASIDHAAQMQVRNSLNRQDFVNPATGQRIETSDQYTHSWISFDGQSVVLNGDPTFDPNGVVDPVRQSWTELIPVN